MTSGALIELIVRVLQLNEDYIVQDYIFIVGPSNHSATFKGALIPRGNKND